MSVSVIDPVVVNQDSKTSFIGVQKLPPHSKFGVNKNETDWRLTAQEMDDPALTPQITDLHKAGSLFIPSLQNAVAQLTGATLPVATLLSGGINSGAVTTFASLSGLTVTAYSAGTPWGNEHKEAQELTTHLRIPHVLVDFSPEELLAAIPETMRALGTTNHIKLLILLSLLRQ
jgi:asparagine synthetase B (glutamine-hydrolysing)